MVAPLIFILVFLLHIFYFKVSNFGYWFNEQGWFFAYRLLRDYYLGFAYAASVSFFVFSFMKLKQKRRRAVYASLAAGLWILFLLVLNYFEFGSCCSAVWIIYFKSFASTALRIPKWIPALVSLVFALAGYLWLKPGDNI